ncbi:hypothetical protein [Nocardia brevicatena]|uniref:hypothetical protein n=1 Tax=Nocardia brevicatena TaxID=37327 RepID=UPI00030DB2B1|nr:hypothetical protein [Nocardia brevicatena]
MTTTPILGNPDGRGRLYVVPPAARPLLGAAHTYVQLNHPRRSGLLNGGTGRNGRTLRISADTCGIELPARHPWKHTWIASAKTR